MKPLHLALALLLWTTGSGVSARAAELSARLLELNAFWAEVARAVRTGDFEAYRGTCHPEGVLLSGATTCIPLAQALAQWRPGFAETKAGKLKAEVQFRFSQRHGDVTTAHETGIFCYTATDAAGARKSDFVHFAAVLVKNGVWQTLVENQKQPATPAEWDALPP